MHVFDISPLTKLQHGLDNWRTRNKKHWSEMPDAISLTYDEFRYIWIKLQLDSDHLLCEDNIHVPLKKDIDRSRDRYKIFNMLVFIED